jgi:hypothetical protein
VVARLTISPTKANLLYLPADVGAVAGAAGTDCAGVAGAAGADCAGAACGVAGGGGGGRALDGAT